MADAKKPTTKGVPIGEVNVLEVTLGQRGMGKSTKQCARARELAEEYGGAYVIGHSLGARLPKKLPDEFGGGTLPIEYHSTIDELDRALHKRPANWHVLAPPIADGLTPDEKESIERASCDDLIRYTMRLSQALRDAAYQRAHPGKVAKSWLGSLVDWLMGGAKGPALGRRKIRDYDGLLVRPIILVIDEGVAVESASTGQRSKGQDKWFLEWIYSLRHLHTALLYAIQNPTARNWQLLSESTRVTVFYVKHQWALNAIQAAGGTSYEMKLARRLPPYESIELLDDEGPDADELDELEVVEAGSDPDGTSGADATVDTPVDSVENREPISDPTPIDPGKPPTVAP